MKKIVTTIAALAMAVSMFAADFSATVSIHADAAYGQSVDGVSSFGLLDVENTKQKDNDLLELNYAGDKAGAFVRFWALAKEPADYYLGGSEGPLSVGGQYGDKLNVLSVRALKLWFEPAAGVKITLGNNELALYKEQLDWWKVPCGASVTEFNNWDGRWASGAAFHEGFGTTLEVTAIEGLYLGLGAEASFFTKADDADPVIGQWGAVAKYTINGMSFGAAWRNTANWKLLSIGGDFSKDAFYGMIEGKLRFAGAKDSKLAGITIDNYFAYNINGINLQLTAPVTIRGLLDKDDATDPSYMTLRAKVTIPVDAFSVYTILGSDEGFTANSVATKAGSKGATVWKFDNFGDNFNFYGKVGASLNVGVCSLDLGAEFAYDKPSKTFAWALPVVAKVAF